MTPIALKVEVPIASFRQSQAREYAQTYSVPPPSTIYGMLLSMVGEMDRYKHQGIKLAIAMLTKPEKSTVIRTFRRFKKKDIHDPVNARPDYQELLTNIQFLVLVDSTEDFGNPTLAERLTNAFTQPETIERFGGLSLGESRDLVNSIDLLPKYNQNCCLQWLEKDEDGLLTLPYWVDHVGSQGTRWQRYQLLETSNQWEIAEGFWTEIQSA
jgi:CRISPR-associated protein Cas5t